MSVLWTAADASAATGGEIRGNWQVSGVSIDTRTIETGDLFVALKAARDGHEFVSAALAAGAGAALVSHVPDGVDDDANLLIVPDVLAALEDLGRAARARTSARVVAVTGSVGKTSTKEMLRTVLGRQGRVHAAEASYNNHWGVPLTLARMPATADFAVIEIGMSNPGEIAPLARMAAPHVAMVTRIAAAHMAQFDGISAIAREKGDIFQGLTPDGVAVFNSDPATDEILTEAANGHKILRFGPEETADYQVLDVTLADDTTVIQADLAGDAALFKLSIAGRHFASNGVAVLAAVDALGADMGRASVDLALWQPPAGRGTRETVQLDAVETQMCLDLIDDAFNANPTSMEAALEVLAAALPRDGVGRIAKGRRVAILGDMLELGSTETRDHQDLAKLASMDKIDLVHTVGPRMAHLHAVLPAEKQGQHRDTAGEFAGEIHRWVDAGDVTLVKGSKGSKVSQVVDAIRKLGQVAPTDK